MSDKKTLHIDPNMFSMSSGGTTRKKRAAVDKNKEIKIKTASPKNKNDSLKKKSILKMIRQHQSARYNTLFENKSTAQSSEPVNSGEFNKEFKEATLFFDNLTEKNKEANKMKNYTLKQYPSTAVTPTTNSLLFHPSTLPIPPPLTVAENIIPNVNQNNTLKLASPLYGCLKNGTLPTYKNYMNVTQKNRPSISPIIIGGNAPMQNGPMQNAHVQNVPMQNVPMQNGPITNTQMGGISQIDKRINESMNRINTMNQTAAKIKELKPISPPIKKKQKRTVRRTYKIGKSKTFPRVSVLVSNKTIRNNISTTTQLLKQTPIQDVKKYLIKRGFIKVGSVAPNDVLRKMYESATLICGEVQNYNPDNLLYNFMNENEA